MKEMAELLALAEHIAQTASQVVLQHFRACLVEYKPDGSEVTIADRLAEEAIREILCRECPTHAILGEEFGGEFDAEGYTWVVDPIDGTTYFAMGVPLFGTLIGLLHNGEPIAGVIRFPVLGETVYAGQGLGCWRRLDREVAAQVHVAADKPLREAFCSASGVHGCDLSVDTAGIVRLGSIIRQAGKFRMLGDCQQHALLCRGCVDLAIDTMMQPWDTAALVPCIREAGGIATSISGEARGVVSSGSLLAACGPIIHTEAVRLLNVSSSGAARHTQRF
ncbi:inositol monophosphatase family protein [Microvirga rosea]|uniref:inositol monophosphatase family protein n=1 Tax=Microvirga rosea TaxID=2715425 RepID=UPI001D0A68AD|nr:inositol monophosphatase family protein [Microvirga rosea]MCB8823145.1 hypothetical protein [Microvirga rosea]